MMSELQPGITEHFLSELNLTTESVRDVRVVCGYNMTDMGNASRLIALHGERIRYCAELKEWFLWDGVRWAPDTTNYVQELAKDAVRLIHAEVSFMSGAAKAERKKLTDWAYASEAHVRINAMIKEAQSDRRIAVKAGDFDANKWLINTPEGTINLEGEKCELRPHNRDELLTKVTLGRHNPDADGWRYYKTLFESLSPSEVAFFQHAWGSALEPTIKNKALFILYGRSNSKKSTCSEPPLYALGDYACTQNITTFIKTPKRGGAARPDIVSLEGVHVAYCEETPAGMVFDDATIKSLTSLARQRARTLYQVRERDIELICTFFIETNELPRIDTIDNDQAEAVFNRLYVISFTHPIANEDVDPSIKQTLITEQEALDAVLTWVINGYFDYAKTGLCPPDSVKEASEDYQLKMNPLAEFFKDEIVADDGSVKWARVGRIVRTLSKDIYAHFDNVASLEVRKLVKNKSRFGVYFSKLAKAKGFESEHTDEGTAWLNLRIRDWSDEGKSNKAQNKEPDRLIEKTPFLIKSPCKIRDYYAELKKHTFTISLSAEPVAGSSSNTENAESSDKHDNGSTDIGIVEQATLAEDIIQILRGFKKGRSGPIDLTTDEVAAAIAETIKTDKPELQDYPVEQFYKKLIGTDKEAHAIIADCALGRA
jgi:P4 family phage/plasmid primase-like protien